MKIFREGNDKVEPSIRDIISSQMNIPKKDDVYKVNSDGSNFPIVIYNDQYRSFYNLNVLSVFY